MNNDDLQTYLNDLNKDTIRKCIQTHFLNGIAVGISISALIIVALMWWLP